MVHDDPAQDGSRVVPPRGGNAAWQAAVRHAQGLPADTLALWVCRAGHRYVVAGPVVEFRSMHLVCVKDGSHRAGRELMCSCGERPMNRIPVDRGRLRAAKALFLIGGLEAVREFFQKIAPPDNASSQVRTAGWLPMTDQVFLSLSCLAAARRGASAYMNFKDMARIKFTVFECPDCGRVWAFGATPAQVGADLARLANGLNPAIGEVHVGGCIDGEPGSWTTSCKGDPVCVKPWPEIEAAFRLGGVDAATEIRRSRGTKTQVAVG